MNNKSKEFLFAVDTVKNLAKTPNNEELLNLYGLYKKAIVGNINIDKPNFLMVKECAKWEAWNKCAYS